MNFIEAIKAIKRNENISVKRKETIVSYYKCFDKLYIDAKYQSELDIFVPTVYDILSEDWYVVKNEKLYTFEQALTAYKSGKSIRRKSSMIHNEISYVYMDNCDLDRDYILADDWEILP